MRAHPARDTRKQPISQAGSLVQAVGHSGGSAATRWTFLR